MNPRSPVVVLSTREGARLREMVRESGLESTGRALGIEIRTLLRAAAEAPIARLTAEVIRNRLDRI